MTAGRLWAGWRSAYVTAAGSDSDAATPATGDCLLCALTGPGDDRDNYVVWRGVQVAAVLNAYPYTSGHLMVAPTRHVGELEDLEQQEAVELWQAVTLAVRAMKAAYRPGGLNVGINLGRPAGAGVPGHLHVHVLPRWEGDTNFMASVAEVRVLPEALGDTWNKLRQAWPAP